MNADTKHHIDSARQVLVGVVPNPTSQIEQITNALIYKFMDDMDQSAIKVGGDPSFFVGDLEQYAWTRIMDSRIGNQERMNLYSEALVKFSQAKQLPELFRNIFRQAFLPYRSPETLGLFLKEINYFDYSHPEELGNAYEYLLSIMSSQGDAGQFRTPRHIIDFIVDVVNPTKDDRVLDPACGTAGFLISSYKHILEQHDGKDDPEKKEKPLTPDDRKKLMNNFEGYDIDPTMVRIAQVNMYLHQFKNPKIYQYDSLSSDEKWNDKFDVILANPPFMSPKGGIKPHNKFSIQSSRSEVLFVDYIMNHLRPNGRAGVIVPEGIIFQSATAHKQLRKNLVEDGLYAVVSLPSGVFNPYAGVKTSILLFDNEIAKRVKHIMFVKISNDGFDLGAQRRAVSGSDLPMAVDALVTYRKHVLSGGKLNETGWPGVAAVDTCPIVGFASKEKIAENGDYNLSGDRYRAAKDYTNAKWPMVKLGDICDIYQPKTITSNEIKGTGKYKVFGANGVIGYFDEYNHEEAEIAVTCRGATCGTVNFTEPKSWITGNAMVVKPKNSTLSKRYLFHLLRSTDLSSVISGAAQPQITGTALKPFLIPLPTLEIQEQIVKELDGYTAIISGAKKIISNWKPKIDIDPQWEKAKIGDICKIERGASPRPIDKYTTNDPNGFNWVKIGDTKNSDKYITQTTEKITKEGAEKSRKVFVGDFVLSNSMSFGRPYIMKIEGYIHDGWLRLSENPKKIGKDFLYYILSSSTVVDQFEHAATGGVVRNLNSQLVKNVEISLPPLEIQEQIVEKIEGERILIESTKKLIKIYEDKTKLALDKLYGHDN